MSGMHSKIKNEIKEAMKVRDSVKRDCLKNILGKAQIEAKEKHLDFNNIPDDVVYSAVQKENKQLRQTVEQLSNAQDTELYRVSALQIELLKDYLPEQMSEKEVQEAVAWILGDNPPDNFGAKMKAVMPNLKGRADSKLIRKVVEEYK